MKPAFQPFGRDLAAERSAQGAVAEDHEAGGRRRLHDFGRRIDQDGEPLFGAKAAGRADDLSQRLGEHPPQLLAVGGVGIL